MKAKIIKDESTNKYSMISHDRGGVVVFGDSEEEVKSKMKEGLAVLNIVKEMIK